MNLQAESAPGRNLFTAYGEGWVEVNAKRHAQSLVVLPERVIEGWTAAKAEALELADFEFLATLDAEVILLGAPFPAPALLAPLIRARKALEPMPAPAACRTYNVLATEGRKVAAALIL
ncbi:MAG: MTH938/NDUFAF3 family protein [Candidatus Accumulibacter sp.]|jgi:uncharacterized protein|nr:MTH938/NDUFAF3 family protein [Accumulibacter sp.]